MKIDTIILSGGSSKGISFLGTFNYLIENQYIDRDLKNIKKIICVSASFLFTLMILLHESDFIQMKKDMIYFIFCSNYYLIRLYWNMNSCCLFHLKF